jgi:hypothetical protein
MLEEIINTPSVQEKWLGIYRHSTYPWHKDYERIWDGWFWTQNYWSKLTDTIESYYEHG